MATTVFTPVKYKTCEADHNDQDLSHYIIVRGDLSNGQKFAQCIHAVGESVSGKVPENTVAVGLQCKDEQDLMAYHDRLTAAGIEHVLICECDGIPQAIGCSPTRDRKKMRRLLSSLPLIK